VNRREFITLLGAGAGVSIWWPRTAGAEASAKVRRLGILLQGSAPTPLTEALQSGLHELGWVEGRNLAIEWRPADGSIESLPRLAAELVELGVDLIVAAPVAPTLAAKEATGTLPVVFVQVPDPVGLGIVPKLGRPGGNVTGLSSIASDLSGKRLALVKEALPTAGRVAVLWNHASRAAPVVVEQMMRMKGEVGLELVNLGIVEREELEGAFATAAECRVAAVMVIDDPVMESLRAPVVQLAEQHRLPIFSQYASYVDAGGLMAYGPSLAALYHRAATYVDRIFKGANPGELPVEQPTVFELVINLKTANALGLDLAPTVVARADRVIE
jgi:putative ABC transport system substrate-binding protein